MISVVLTCYQEADKIGCLMEDFLLQSKKPDELIIVDAGSKDGTVDIINSFQNRFQQFGISLRLIIKNNINISQGRNAAIQSARFPIIVGTDAGCRLKNDWLYEITLPLIENRADFCGGFFLPVSHNRFQECLATLTTSPKPVKDFLPSSRSIAFYREQWKAVGGYPEYLPWGEDTLFNKRLIDNGARYIVAEKAIVYWEVRANLSAAIKQHYRYAYGDGLAGRKSVFLIINFVIIVLSVFSSIFISYWMLFALVIYAISWPIRKDVRFPRVIYATYVSFGLQLARAVGFGLGCCRAIKRRPL